MCRGVEVSKSDFGSLEKRQLIPKAAIENAKGDWDVYREIMHDHEIQEWLDYCGGDWTDLLLHPEPDGVSKTSPNPVS